MSDQTLRAAAYFRGHKRVSRLDLYTAGVMRPDREVARLREQGWEFTDAFASGEDIDDPRLGGWYVVTVPPTAGVSVAPAPPQAIPMRHRWVCTKPNCGLDSEPDPVFTMLDEKGRMTTGKCPKHGRPVLLRRVESAHAATTGRGVPTPDPARVQRPVLPGTEEQQEGGRERSGTKRHV